MKDFRDLSVWRRAHELTLAVYRATAPFPSDERYGLTSQLRRSAMSVPSNIAEGCGRGGDTDFARFIQIAIGSASEVEYQLLLAKDLEYLEQDAYESLASDIVEVRKMLIAFIKKLRA